MEREAKAHILAQIQSLDTQADASGLDEDEWALRYHLEDELMQILCAEEEYWRQRGHQNWLPKGMLIQRTSMLLPMGGVASARFALCNLRKVRSQVQQPSKSIYTSFIWD
jgi:hypothetical protein